MDIEIINDYWNRFLEKSNIEKSTKYFEITYFDDNEVDSEKLLQLVLAGKKRATASSYLAYHDNLPKIGDYTIVTNFFNIPKCIIKTTNILVLPFKDVTYEICKREGEDDSLESWQRGHINFFTGEGKRLGYQFSWDMLVIFEDFEVVYKE